VVSLPVAVVVDGIVIMEQIPPVLEVLVAGVQVALIITPPVITEPPILEVGVEVDHLEPLPKQQVEVEALELFLLSMTK